ncbi:MAG TPA: DinB family protein [Gemmatimonadales bacterium]|nr:DinB family protein [Gemmatimonadales bacterium]
MAEYGAGTIESVRAILRRDLEAMKREIAAYPDDAGPWRVASGLPNTAGTLALHCAGNVRHFIGARLGGSGYVRDRAAEFSARDVPRAGMVALLDAAIAESGAALARLEPARLEAEYPDVVGGARVQNGDVLLQIAAHLAYHLGQVDAHRRITTGDATGVGAMSFAELATAKPAS